MSRSAATRSAVVSRASPPRNRTRRTPRLVLFSYPLHPPGAPERTDARIAHWPAIRCPVLLLSGEADPFAKIDLLRASVGKLQNAELVTYPRLGHTLKPVLEDVLDRTAAFLLKVSATDRGRPEGGRAGFGPPPVRIRCCLARESLLS